MDWDRYYNTPWEPTAAQAAPAVREEVRVTDQPTFTQNEIIGFLLLDADLGEARSREKYATSPSGLAIALRECALVRAAAAEIERLQSALDAAPVREEREGRCWCEDRNIACTVQPLLDYQHYPSWYVDGHTRTPNADYPFYCPRCGASLHVDGIARRWVERDAK